MLASILAHLEDPRGLVVRVVGFGTVAVTVPRDDGCIETLLAMDGGDVPCGERPSGIQAIPSAGGGPGKSRRPPRSIRFPFRDASRGRSARPFEMGVGLWAWRGDGRWRGWWRGRSKKQAMNGGSKVAAKMPSPGERGGSSELARVGKHQPKRLPPPPAHNAQHCTRDASVFGLVLIRGSCRIQWKSQEKSKIFGIESRAGHVRSPLHTTAPCL